MLITIKQVGYDNIYMVIIKCFANLPLVKSTYQHLHILYYYLNIYKFYNNTKYMSKTKFAFYPIIITIFLL